MKIDGEFILYAKWVENTSSVVDCSVTPNHEDCDTVNQHAPGIVNVLDDLPSEDITISLLHAFSGDKLDLLERFIDEYELMYPKCINYCFKLSNI